MDLKSQPKKKKKKPDPKIRILHFYEVLEYLICGDRNQNSSLIRVGVRIDSKGAVGNWGGGGGGWKCPKSCWVMVTQVYTGRGAPQPAGAHQQY